MNKLFKVFIHWMDKEKESTEIICPACGYYCLGDGGYWCIDKLKMYEDCLISEQDGIEIYE